MVSQTLCTATTYDTVVVSVELVSSGIKNEELSDNRVSVYPNPNKGSMTVRQKLPDNEPVNTEIWDGEGKCIYKTTLNFIDSKARIEKKDMVPGLYLLQLRDQKGERYITKFTVN
jgi:hypothetical protein